MSTSNESPQVPIPLSGDQVADLLAEFQECDVDGDGRVGYAEFDRVLQSTGSRLSAAERRREFTRIDTDGNNLINLAEFKRWWQGG